MKWILTLMITFFVIFTYGQTNELKKIRVCDDAKLEKYFNNCLSNLNFSTEREKKYYIGECRKQSFAAYCEYKWAVITKKDTIFCGETKKKKYLKLCETKEL